MSAVSLIVSVIAGLFGLVGFVALARAQLVGAKDQANLRSMERAVESRDAEIEGLRLDVARHERTIAALTATDAAHEVTIGRQSDEISQLRAERPSADEIKAIKAKLEEHDAKVLEFMQTWSEAHADDNR